jgi:group I intron endonuclease
MGCIYKISNKINGKSYIGQTVYDSPKKRWNTHKNIYKQEKHQEYLYRGMRKYGIENFEFTVICKCKKEELSDLECKYIKEFNTFGSGYNMTSGGEGRRDCKVSEETRKKISLAGIGRVPSEETRKKLSLANMGHKCTDETREKLRKASTGVVKKPSTIEKLKVAVSQRVIKDSTREKLRNNMLGKPKSPEHIANVKKAKRVLSEEDVKYIRNNPDKLKGTELALKFNSSRASISRILNNKRYI